MRPRLLPTVSRYVLREFFRTFAICLAAFIGLYLCVDFFERFPSFLEHGASLRLVLLYFVLKTPLIVTQMTPVAVLPAMLLSLGSLARRNELMAMRSCGISLWQIGVPLAAASAGVALFSLAWNEYVVPGASLQAHYVEQIRIKNKKFRGAFDQWAIWYYGPNSFTNIDHFDARRNEIYNLRRYEFDDDFELRRIVEVGVAHWSGNRWVTRDVRETDFAPDGSLQTRLGGGSALPLKETPDDFTAVLRDADELSSLALARQIKDLHAKGIDTTEATVDFWLKFAVPFVSVVMALLAIPLASRHSRSASLAANVGVALVVGFSYWVVLALTTSLGKGGVLPPLVAAWSANLIFGTIGIIFFLSSE